MQSNFKRSPRKKSTPIFANGRRIGKVSGDTFYKTLKPSGFMTNPPAICFDVLSLKDAERYGATQVEVKALESGALYSAPISLIWAQGTRRNFVLVEQIFLPLSIWDYKAPRKPKASPKKEDPKPTPPQTKQLSLFSR